MVVPLIVWGAAAAVTALSGATYFGLSNRAPDNQITNQYSTTNQYQTKKTALTLGKGASIGTLTFSDSMSQKSDAAQLAKQQGSSGSLLNNPLVLAAAGAGVAYLVLRGK